MWKAITNDLFENMWNGKSPTIEFIMQLCGLLHTVPSPNKATDIATTDLQKWAATVEALFLLPLSGTEVDCKVSL